MTPVSNAERRFWGAKLDVLESGCWEFMGYRTPSGYGRVEFADGSLAHRFAYTRIKGEIPAGLQLDHLCRNRACVNPDHLEPVTPAENMRRAWAVRRGGDVAS